MTSLVTAFPLVSLLSLGSCVLTSPGYSWGRKGSEREADPWVLSYPRSCISLLERSHLRAARKQHSKNKQNSGFFFFFGLSRLLEHPASSHKPRGSFLFMLMFNIHGLPYWTPELDFAIEREVQRECRWAVTPGSSEDWRKFLLGHSAAGKFLCVSGSLVELGKWGEGREQVRAGGKGEGRSEPYRV